MFRLLLRLLLSCCFVFVQRLIGSTLCHIESGTNTSTLRFSVGNQSIVGVQSISLPVYVSISVVGLILTPIFLLISGTATARWQRQLGTVFLTFTAMAAILDAGLILLLQLMPESAKSAINFIALFTLTIIEYHFHLLLFIFLSVRHSRSLPLLFGLLLGSQAGAEALQPLVRSSLVGLVDGDVKITLWILAASCLVLPILGAVLLAVEAGQHQGDTIPSLDLPSPIPRAVVVSIRRSSSLVNQDMIRTPRPPPRHSSLCLRVTRRFWLILVICALAGACAFPLVLSHTEFLFLDLAPHSSSTRLQLLLVSALAPPLIGLLLLLPRCKPPPGLFMVIAALTALSAFVMLGFTTLPIIWIAALLSGALPATIIPALVSLPSLLQTAGDKAIPVASAALIAAETVTAELTGCAYILFIRDRHAPRMATLVTLASAFVTLAFVLLALTLLLCLADCWSRRRVLWGKGIQRCRCGTPHVPEVEEDDDGEIIEEEGGEDTSTVTFLLPED